MAWFNVECVSWSHLTSTRSLILLILACAAGWWVLPLLVEILRAVMVLGVVVGLAAVAWRVWGRNSS